MKSPTSKELADLRRKIETLEYHQLYNKQQLVFPESGELNRFQYPKQLEFFKAGKKYKIRAMIAANRVGKTYAGGYETALHLTGLYPDWWEGRRFDTHIQAIAAGVTADTTKLVIQKMLLGDYTDMGSGMIPKHLIVGKPTYLPGVPEAIQTVRVRHVSGGVSILHFKSYVQGREKFQGFEAAWIWLDEEPTDQSIFSECLTRTMTVKGSLIATFTPLFGVSEVVLSFLPGGKFPKDGHSSDGVKHITQITWDEAPHLSKEERDLMLAQYSDHERQARSEGMPQLGSGAIYPIPLNEILVKPFKIPDFWRRAYGFDVSFNRTAAVWAAQDPDGGTWYIYSEYVQGDKPIPVHAEAIKARGTYIWGAVDPAAKKFTAGHDDNRKFLELYQAAGLLLELADNVPGSGILKVRNMLETGELKVFSTLENWQSEYLLYRRDEKGNVVKKFDDAMDATRYLIATGIKLAVSKTESGESEDTVSLMNKSQRDYMTGY